MSEGNVLFLLGVVFLCRTFTTAAAVRWCSSSGSRQGRDGLMRGGGRRVLGRSCRLCDIIIII